MLKLLRGTKMRWKVNNLPVDLPVKILFVNLHIEDFQPQKRC